MFSFRTGFSFHSGHAFTVILGLMIALGALASGPASAMDRQTAKEIKILNRCLNRWEKHPFGTDIKPGSYKVLEGGVSIAGMGGAGIEDRHQSDGPRLILVKPSVSVLTKTTYNLLNDNGWYCIRGQVTVMGAAEINLACHAKLMSSSGSRTVLGENKDQTGTTVMGKTSIHRKCNGSSKRPPEKGLDDIQPIDDAAVEKGKI